MEIHYPPLPEYRERGELQTHDYQVVFWQHQLPPPGHTQEQMGWAELTWDIQNAEDVWEVIAWAESYLNEFAAEYPGAEHTYCVYAKVPGKDWLLHLGGVNPSANPHRETFGECIPLTKSNSFRRHQADRQGSGRAMRQCSGMPPSVGLR